MLILLAALAAQAAAPPVAQDDITVITERMRRLKIGTKTDRKTGAMSCVFRRRSGDDTLDGRVCTALLACAKTVTTAPQMEACLAPTMEAYAREMKQRREAAKP